MKSVLEAGKPHTHLFDSANVTCTTISLCLLCICDHIFNHIEYFFLFFSPLQTLSSVGVQNGRYLLNEQAFSYCSVLSPQSLFAEHSSNSAMGMEFLNFTLWVFSDLIGLNQCLSLVLNLFLQREMRILLVSLSVLLSLK